MKPKNKTRNLSFFYMLRRLLPLTLGQFKPYALLQVFVAVFMMLDIILQTVVSARFFDSVSAAVGTGDIGKPVIWLAAFGLLIVLQPIVNGILNFCFGDLTKRMTGKLLPLIQLKAQRIPALAFEEPETLDDINKAETGAHVGCGLVLVTAAILTAYLPYFILMALYLYSLKPILGIAPVLAFIPVVLSQLVRARVFTQLEDKAAPMRRKMEHYEKCVGAPEFFKETRLLGAFGFYKKLYRQTLSLFNKEKWRAQRKTGLIELGMELITLAGYGIMLFLLVDALLSGEITPGSFAAVFASIGGIFNMMEEMIVQNFGEVMQNKGAVANLIRFLDMPEQDGADRASVKEGVSLENVRFKYPSAAEESIKGVDLKIRPGETLAVVGTNGAGKSTLVKLIMGLYTPTSGTVRFGGTDLKKADKMSMFQSTSAVFQDYGRYKMTLKDNVEISAEEGRLNEALIQADVDGYGPSYPAGLDTMLSREFDGVDVSGGQWQRIAIARGLYRTHDLIVLDEPTAAIDPMEETKIYKKFAQIAKDSTAVIVTHRLGSARIADRIAVMNGGVISQIGTHDELIEREGIYRQMWEAQAAWLV